MNVNNYRLERGMVGGDRLLTLRHAAAPNHLFHIQKGPDSGSQTTITPPTLQAIDLYGFQTALGVVAGVMASFDRHWNAPMGNTTCEGTHDD